MEGALFITGMQRSGTTLLEKLLATHPAVSVLSQPFPLLWVEAKRGFLADRGHSDVYPLGPLLDEQRYQPAELSAFLESYRLAPGGVRAQFERMADYSGQYTAVDPVALEQAVATLPGGGYAELVAHLWRCLSGRPGAALCGAKEIMCEEFLPYLAGAGVRCLLILRDPRDVLASLNTGRGRDYGGELKPTLFNLHHWRKSVAFALHLESSACCAWLTYEALVADPGAQLARLTRELLGVKEYSRDWLAGGLRDQSGEVWAGNSSHGVLGAVSGSSVGRYAQLLPPEVVRYAEAICWPELRLLGYDCSLDRSEAAAVIREFREPYAITRAGLAGYTDDPAMREAELRRLALLDQPVGPESRRLFLFDDVHARLQAAVAS